MKARGAWRCKVTDLHTHQTMSLNPQQLHDAVVWLERNHRFWTDRLDSLERYLTEENR